MKVIKISKIRKLICVILIITISEIVMAQKIDSTIIDGFYLETNQGTFITSSSLDNIKSSISGDLPIIDDFIYTFSGGVIKDNKTLAISYSISSNPIFFAPNKTLRSVNVLIGQNVRIFKNKSIFFHPQIGIGQIWGFKYENEFDQYFNEGQEYSLINIPVSGELKICTKYFSIGGKIAAFITEEHTSTTALLSLSTGFLNFKK